MRHFLNYHSASIKLISIYYFISGLSVGTDSPKLGDRFSFKELGWDKVFFTPLPSFSLTWGTQPTQMQWHVSKLSANIYPGFLISWFPSYPYPNKKGLENERPGIMCMWSLPTTGSPLPKNYNTGSRGQPQFPCTYFPKLANFQKGSKSKSLKYVRKMKWKAMDSTQKKREAKK